MHPDIINGSSDTAIIQPNSAPHNQAAQYGFPVSVSTEPPIRADPRAVAGSGGVIDDAGSGEGFPERTSRLNVPEGSSVEELPRDDGGSESSKKDAIRKYEAMSASFTTEAAFRIKKTNWDGRRDSPISRFPNEILIHALSFLDPQTLLTAALISRRFYSLITSPDAWRSAFSRYFPSITDKSSSDIHESPASSSSQDRRYFTRLSVSDNGINSWRREYILRTRLLRSLGRGRASLATSASSPTNHNSHGSIVITYAAAAWSVSHIAASFTPRGVRLLHASVHTPGVVSATDPTIGRIERCPVMEPPLRPDLHQPLLGLHGFEVATDMGTSGVMDLSEDIGWIYGENVPCGKVYVHPYTSPYVTASQFGMYIRPEHENMEGARPAVTAVWIAKRRSSGVLETTQGRVGVVVGNSRGVVSIYGLSFGKETRLTSTKRFTVSPGIPIVSIRVDDDYSIKRMKQKNIWMVVVNALGEVYYLKDSLDSWKIIPQTARTTTVLCNSIFPIPATRPTEDQQAKLENARDEKLMKMSYGAIKELWEGWGMDWFIEVDWPNQNVVIGKKQSIERRPRPQDDVTESILYRYHLVPRASRLGAKGDFVRGLLVINPTEEIGASESSLFGGPVEDSVEKITNTIKMEDSPNGSPNSAEDVTDGWIATQLKLGEKGFHIITATAMDNSNLALLSDREEYGADADVPGGNARLFAVGTSMGCIFLWNIRSPVLPDIAGVGVHEPSRVIHTDSPQIASLALSSLYLVHGGTDGLVQAWDPLGSTLSRIRDIHSRFTLRARRRLAQADAGAQDEFGIGDNQFAARCIVLDPDATTLRGAVALGTHIRYWSFPTPVAERERKRRKQGTRPRAGGAPSRASVATKGVIEWETRHLLKEKERERKEKEDLKNRYGIASGRAALSEEEMVEYATMISRETFERENGSTPTDIGESVTSSRTVTPDAAPSVSSYKTADEYKTPPEHGHDEDVDMDLAEALRLSLLENGLEDGGSSNRNDGVWEDADYLYSDPGPNINHSTSHYSPYHYTGASSSSSRPENSNSMRSDASPMPPSKSRGWERLPLDKIDGRPIVGKGRGKYQSNDKEEEDFENEMEMAIRLSLMVEEERRGIMKALAEDDDDFGKGKGKGRA